MNSQPSALYQAPPPTSLDKTLAMARDRGMQRASSLPVRLFFRADDIGVPSSRFARMIALFQRHRLPLCLAVVPTWLTADRLARLREYTGDDDWLWCWHQHGRLHRNFESTGKKQEFGPARNYAAVRRQLLAGRQRLEMLLGESFFPFFTPPWNRCSRQTLLALRDLHFKGLSRSRGARPEAGELLPDIQVNVDLHTRKETDPQLGLVNLVQELEDGLACGCCGIMLHHQRMNENAFLLLERLLSILAATPGIRPCRFNDLI